jgi:hypothetical protein
MVIVTSRSDAVASQAVPDFRRLIRPGEDAWPALVAVLRTPRGMVVALILATALARFAFAALLGLGIDESYMAAASRTLHLSYYDHPPVAWWLAWIAERTAGRASDVGIRTPFILLFALSTWLMYRLAGRLYGERAGFWAATALNAAPVLGVTTGSWILPDGPLVAALLGATLCLVRALPARGRAAWTWWLLTGAWAGVALCSKYTAAPIMLGVALFLVTTPTARGWLGRPHPYVAGLLACSALLPVIIWNAEHDWASIRFQGGRAAGAHWHVFGPLTTLLGESLFFLPWLFVPLLILLWEAARRGPGEPRGWLLVCLSVPSFAFFLLVSFRAHVLVHWAAPALMLALPMLGNAIALRRFPRGGLRFAVVGTVSVVAFGMLLVGSEVCFNWLPEVAEDFRPGADPDLAAVDWSTVRDELYGRDLLGPETVIAAVRWHEAGKIDFAMKGNVPVICLGDDPRQYGMAHPVSDYAGRDVVIIAPKETLGSMLSRFGDQFDSIEARPPLTLLHAGKPAALLPVFVGHGLRTPPPH